MSRIRPLLLIPALALAVTDSLRSHEIPVEVVARLLARADGETFRVVARVPLRSIRDVEVPGFGPGYLDIESLSPQLPDLATQWIAPFVRIHEDGSPLPMATVAATQISLPSDRSIESMDRALAHLAGAKPGNAENLVWSQVMFDALLEYPVQSPDSDFAMSLGLVHLASKVTTALAYELPGGTTRAFQFTGDPGLVPLDPSWLQAAWRFVKLGFEHILDGVDHLLFLCCLVIPLRRLRPLVLIVTAFTIAHSVTLISSAAGLAPDALWFPPLVETLIAVSILYMALENIVGPTRRRWAFALGFGLVHGFGFSFALRETLQFAGSHLLTSLLAFNVGVELGQVFVLLLLVPVLGLLFQYVVAERVGTIILSALAAHQAWHWSVERAEVFGMFNIDWMEGNSIPWWMTGAALALIAAAWWKWRKVQVARQQVDPAVQRR